MAGYVPGLGCASGLSYVERPLIGSSFLTLRNDVGSYGTAPILASSFLNVRNDWSRLQSYVRTLLVAARWCDACALMKFRTDEVPIIAGRGSRPWTDGGVSLASV